ncbi:MAG: aldo/keto reductase [Deltaproteobacteria bacterium]|nr:aldo/keto reductase [Deltaproteobacteria bacterium]MCW5805776.1 aldo/keto reductase [Deltaproteobacteria bacterium]
MQLDLLGRTGVKVSRIALGAMSFGGDADEATAWTIWRAARDAGVNLIDTADVYNDGRSEEFIGRFMRGERDQLVIASKAYFPTGPDANARGSSRLHLMRAVERSLQRLATDRIDLYYLHRFDDVTDLDQTLRALEDLVRAGKILYPACSNFAAWQIAHALGRQAVHGWAPLVATQPMYNLVKRQAEVEILPAAHALGVAVIPYSPTGGGLLTGKYGVGRAPDKGRLLDTKMYQVRYASADYYRIAESFTELAAELGHHPVTLAVAWVASHPAVTSVLVGGRNAEQLAPSLAAAGVILDDATRARISALSPEPPPATDRNEEKSAHNYGAR